MTSLVWPHHFNGYLIKKVGHTRETARTGAVTLIQRFGSALNLNIHFHCLFLDGVYRVGSEPSTAVFESIAAPTHEEISGLLHQISDRIGRHLERQGLLVRDVEQSCLALEGREEDDLSFMQASSITYRIAVGPWCGRKVFTIQTLPPQHGQAGEGGATLLAKQDGFSLHAGVAVRAHDRNKVERLCRYIARPAVSSERLSLTQNGKIRYALKTPYRDGTTHVVFVPLDFIARLVALVPKPRVNLTRFHGVFAPNSALRALVTGELKQRIKGKPALSGQGATCAASERRGAMTWAKRLKRVFEIDVIQCSECQARVKIIACIEDKEVVAKILKHLNLLAKPVDLLALPESRGPPMSLF